MATTTSRPTTASVASRPIGRRRREGGLPLRVDRPFGYKAVENKVHLNDLRATLLYLLGIVHKKLTYRHNGRNFGLANVGGHMIPDLIA